MNVAAKASVPRKFRALCWVAVTLIGLVSGCWQPGGRNELDPERFRTAIASAREQGLTVYWVGRQFDVAEVSFDWIDPDTDERDNAITAVLLHYVDSGPNGDLPISGALDVTSLTALEWENRRDRVQYPADIPGILRKNVELAGKPAELMLIPLASQPLNSIQLIVEFHETVVVASANAFITEDGGNSNPLLDETTFLSVLENLRPYPE